MITTARIAPHGHTLPALTSTGTSSTRTSSTVVCIPARNEARTIGAVIETIRERDHDVVVVDDGSTDQTARIAWEAGARVISTPPRGKGQALGTAVESTTSDLLVFIDADLTSLRPEHVDALTTPLLADDQIMLVKPRYQRSLNGRPAEGGRVNELMARPLLRLRWPGLAHLSQPLAGECALRRTAIDNIRIADGYAVELALLTDIAHHYGPDAITEIDLGPRHHRNRPLHELSDQATEILAAALDRLDTHHTTEHKEPS